MKTVFCFSLMAAFVLLDGNLQAEFASFANSTSITIRDGTSALPYPSTVTVAGLTGAVSQVSVQLKSLVHSQMSDVDMLLVAPSGAKLVLFSDVGGNNPFGPANIILDDTASSTLPTTSLSAGTYHPGDYGAGADIFLSPAPAIAFSGDSAAPNGTATFTTKFSGAAPNGVWSLYIMDDTTNSFSGSVGGGWVLTLTTVPTLPRPILTNALINASGKFQFGFTGVTTTNYSVYVSTNLMNWSAVGTASEISAGVFRYIDPQPRTNAVRYYRVHSP